MRPEPIFSQPDPERQRFVQLTATKLVRRGPREFYLVGRQGDGSEVAVRLGRLTLAGDGS